jgi:pyruvate/2-oxoglutarate dehydrogenase complex dihydrolipoamide acyltransferase (E2) component
VTTQLDPIETLTHGERWFLDGFSVLHHPGGVLTKSCDMSQAKRVVTALRSLGHQASYLHVMVRAIALALARCPEAHQLVCGYRRMRPSRVDIGLSVAGQTSYAPVLVIGDATARPLPALVKFLKEEVPRTREKELRDLEGMRRTGWIIPFGWLRRAILRLLNNMFWFRRKLIGTFQVTCLRQVDQVIPLVFYSGAALGIGEVSDRVVAIAGQPEVRPMVTFTMAFDHRTLDGLRTADLLAMLCKILESDELLKEVSETPLMEQSPLSLPGPVAKPAEAPLTPSASAGG